MLENWININNKPNLYWVWFCYYLDRFARHASCSFSIWSYHLLGCPGRWVITETSGKQWQHSVWFIDLRIGWHGTSSRFTFPWVTQLNRGQLTLQWSNKIIGNTNAGYQLLSRAVGAHVQRGFIGTDQPRLRSPTWRATAPMGESVPWGTRAGLTKIWGRDILWGKRQRLGSCCGKMLGNASRAA